ncbi:MAG: hypothetical protein WBJ36_05330 [Tenuifilum sp.]|uniref:hypothetical protein n=1 Tax=Tenuifilum sp. TaxID=2760880 RepID=UPI001B73A4CA|nr:hypothetical protein [Bacteroidales bacterium]HOK61951.1 hypothetical protein [Tenuifilum sp.]MBP9028711.1 hypothetical protein [Bacteroidales bacterium]HOK86757.1 hypothetical protein [Tenuifilum sp.]HPP90940.1 hypothetical protein [Tenuifilum sp.]
MGTPWVELPRDTIRHAFGVTHVVSLTKPTATFHPRPIAGSDFYAIAKIIPLGLRNFTNRRNENTKRCFDKVYPEISGLSMTA